MFVLPDCYEHPFFAMNSFFKRESDLYFLEEGVPCCKKKKKIITFYWSQEMLLDKKMGF